MAVGIHSVDVFPDEGFFDAWEYAEKRARELYKLNYSMSVEENGRDLKTWYVRLKTLLIEGPDCHEHTHLS